MTSHPHFNCFPEEGDRLLSVIIRWIYVLTIETVQDQQWVYDAIDSLKKYDIRVNIVDPDSGNIASRKRVNLFVRHANTLACSSFLGQLGRGLIEGVRNSILN